MVRIVTSHYRYQRPPRKRQAAALEVPAVVKAADPAKARKRAKSAEPMDSCRVSHCAGTDIELSQ
jgi:hypothetical protein